MIPVWISKKYINILSLVINKYQVAESRDLLDTFSIVWTPRNISTSLSVISKYYPFWREQLYLIEQ